MKKAAILLLCAVLLCTQAFAQPTVRALGKEIIAREMRSVGAKSVQEMLDGAYASEPTGGAEWLAIAFAQSGEYDFSGYSAALEEYLKENTVRSQVTKQKYALALLATGGSEETVREILQSTLGRQGIMSWVYGLHLMNNGVVCSEATTDDAIEKLLDMQLQDGGWVITGAVSDADVTAMTLQALAPHYEKDQRVKAAVDRALVLFSQIQLEDGSYASYGKPSTESTAQVWIALSSLKINALEDARFVKNGHTLLDGLLVYALEDHTFSHTLGAESNRTATVQAYLALAAYEEMLRGGDGIFILSDAKHVTALEKSSLGYREIASIVILVLAAGCTLMLIVLKKRHYKNFLAVFAIAAVLLAGVQLIKVQSVNEYYGAVHTKKKNPAGEVTLSIRCDVLTGKTEKAHVPADGIILPETVFMLGKDETVYDILLEAARTHTLHMESSGAQGLKYVSGIANLYEYDFGDLSGWLYFVNGVSSSEGCDSYVLKDGDRIEWLYTCAMGDDLK